MNHRDRVIQALSHREPDRIPIDFGGGVSSIMRDCYEKLCGYMGVQPENVQYSIYDFVLNIDERILNEFDIDFRRVWLGEPISSKTHLSGDGLITDVYGIKRKRVGEYIETVFFPLANGSLEDVRKYRFPDPEDPGWLLGAKERAKQLHEKTDYAVVLGMSVDGVFETGTYLFGFEDFLLKLYTEKKLVNYFFDKLLEFLTSFFSGVLQEIGEYIDIVELGDDMANQRQLFFSPAI
jgi:uroporphyrinogen decarboxylase